MSIFVLKITIIEVNIYTLQELEYELRRQGGAGNAYVGLRLAKATPQDEVPPTDSVRKSNDETTVDLLNLQVSN